MSQFDYLGNWNDAWKVLDAILNRPVTRLIADLWYDKPEPVIVTSLDESVRNIAINRRSFFIWADDFSRFPPVLKLVGEDPSKSLYTVHEKLGGPCLRLTLPACYEEDCYINLALGIFSHQSHYFNTQEEVWEPASAEVKAAYKDILARIKKCLVRHQFHKPIWIGPDALRELQEGKARITGFGLEGPKTYDELMSMRVEND